MGELYLSKSASQKDLKKWQEYYKKGIKPTRIKLRSLVFSDNSIASELHFKLHGHELSLFSFPDGYKSPESIEGYIPAFICEVITEQAFHRGGNNFDLHTCLDKVLPLVGFNYRLPLEFEQWEEYEGVWITTLAAGGYASCQTIHHELPNKNLVEVVEAYEIASTKKDKRSKKAVKIRKRLKEAIELEKVSMRYSFLSYYSILEIISDDLASNGQYPTNDPIAAEISKFSLSTRGSQRTKIYYLLKALDNDFDLANSVMLSDIRNDIAHGEQNVDFANFDLCRKLAYWASEKFVIGLTQSSAQLNNQ